MHHLPEVPDSGLHGALSDDEGSLLLVALKEEKEEWKYTALCYNYALFSGE